MICKNSIDFETLIAYWLAEVPAAVEEPLEEHLFSCAHCTRRLEGLASLASGIRAVVRAGAVAAIISAQFLEAMKKQGMRIREYAPPRGERVDCTMTADDDLVVSRLAAPLAGVKRLDAHQVVEIGGQVVADLRLQDVPFDPTAVEVLHAQGARLRHMPAHTARVRLISVEDAGDREIGHYTFKHTPG